MYSHFFLLISLGIIISAWNLIGQEPNKTFLAFFYILGYTGFYLMLFANGIYLDKEKRLNKKDFSKILGILTIFCSNFYFQTKFYDYGIFDIVSNLCNFTDNCQEVQENAILSYDYYKGQEF